MAERISFEDRTSLAAQLADDVAAALSQAISTKGRAVLAVSGGSTPKKFFDALSATDIEWSKVTIMPVDERLVPLENDRSNAGMIVSRLLTNMAANACLSPMYIEGKSPDETAAALEISCDDDLPPDVAILGMGTDGHTASFFPGGSHLAESIDPNTKRRFIPMEAENAGEPRMTLTLPPLLAAPFLALHIEGEEKEMVLLEAERDLADEEAMPIRAVLSRRNLAVYWAP
ncbi:MAG: 6-phosphogluconolactonase [Pseudomonadota bacterium]